MMSKSASERVRWCHGYGRPGLCLGLALVLACARVDGVPGPDPGQVPGTGGAAGAGTGGSGSGSGRGTGGVGSPAGTGGLIMGRDGGEEPICGLFKAPLEKLPPDVLIVLDRSGSMNGQVIPPGFDIPMFLLCLLLNNCPATMSKWVAMTGALQTSVAASGAAVNYGLKFFPTDSDCAVADGAAVPIAPDNVGPINNAIAMTLPGGGTPTGPAVTSAGRYLATLTRPNPRFVLLATDGEPSCGGDAVAAVTSLAGAGVPVYVIGIATQGMADNTLTAMANAGGRPRNATPAYYPVQTAADLSAALSAIGTQIASCTFTVARPDPPADPANVAVKANGMKIPQSDTDGWRWGPGMMSIEISGSWCQQIQSGAITDLQTTFACKGVTVE
jgi:hypothetical protein